MGVHADHFAAAAAVDDEVDDEVDEVDDDADAAAADLARNTSTRPMLMIRIYGRNEVEVGLWLSIEILQIDRTG